MNAMGRGAGATAEERVLAKLDQVLRLLASMATRDMKQRDRIAVLDRAGFAPREIAALLGTSSNTVRVELVTIRRTGRKTRRSQSSSTEA